MQVIANLSQQYLQKYPLQQYPEVQPTVSLAELFDFEGQAFQNVLNDFNTSLTPPDMTDWDVFQTEVLQQYNFLLSKGFRFEFTSNDPYPDARALWVAVGEHIKGGPAIRIYSDGTELNDSHPGGRLCEEHGVSYNVLTRAVHDVFGHCGPRATEFYDFSTEGELWAYGCHTQMFSTKARRAFFSDFPAQSVWVEANNPGPVHLIPIEDLKFAEQKGYKPEFWV